MDGHLASVRDTCQPREEIRRGGLVDKHSAAQLDQVIANAPGYHDYAVADSFVKITHPNHSLKNLLVGTFARLSSNAAAAANAEQLIAEANDVMERPKGPLADPPRTTRSASSCDAGCSPK